MSLSPSTDGNPLFYTKFPNIIFLNMLIFPDYMYSQTKN